MMQIEEKKIRVRELIAGYENDSDKGVHGYGGRLDISGFVYRTLARNVVD